jgi:hypothetical protein
MYPSPDAFNPERFLNPRYPIYKEPLTEFPSIKGHHGFGYGRRVCIGQDLVHSEMLVACGALLWAFTMRQKIGSDGSPLSIDADACTPWLISMPIVHPIDFVVRSEERSQLIMSNWITSLQQKRGELQEK